MKAKKLLSWALVALFAYLLATDPARAGHLIAGFQHVLQAAGAHIATFLNRV